jgi:hypothetical protein
MLADPPIDPLGSLITEARADADVAALVGTRVRGYEPQPGDARGPGEYQAFVTINALDVPINFSVPISFASYGVNCYGVTHQGAWAVWAAIAKCFHRTKARTKPNDLGIYQTLVISGGEQDKDPDTGQPVVRGVLRVIVAAQAVA